MAVSLKIAIFYYFSCRQNKKYNPKNETHSGYHWKEEKITYTKEVFDYFQINTYTYHYNELSYF